ncbi:N-acetyl-gamma-glutamyl-phosphate reductase [Mesonia aquimarina]|uniref:N-acetyl-gamma-glutamyl-phosphate reductase n=1 Tax=Mesonia aquimarina TaxID=1504967 RepID=UPI000EF5ACE3|nr:N-acetyl-gamma-glutamyl-phosphate reductase [Mesonia aquimarina]
MITVGIIGGSGYTGGELIRLLLQHAQVDIRFVYSTTKVGMPIEKIHQDLIGETTLMFTDKIVADVDLVFLCVGHGKSKEFLQKHTFSETTKIIDLSTDFRMEHQNHDFVYGLPEVNKALIMQSNFIANPGCFATAINLALYPAIKHLQLDDVHIHAVTGATGGGARLDEKQHFSWRSQNYSSYKIFQHQHEREILQLFSRCKVVPQLNFIPHRGSFARGIYVTCYTQFSGDLAHVIQLYESFYQDAPFTIRSGIAPHLKQIVNTNKCLLHIQHINDKLVITSMLDNLLKGAAGQAVQNMNLMFGFEETTGLKLKGSYF